VHCEVSSKPGEAQETGDASGGFDGLGGTSARAGYSDAAGESYELPGSGENGALLDSGGSGLVAGGLDSSVPGRYDFAVRGGVPSSG
jgi:hypothetical protein